MPRRAVRAEGRRVNVNTKVTQEIREKIEAAAAASDRPISTEIEFRLDQSFANDVILKTIVGSGIQSEMFRRLALVIRAARKSCKEKELGEIDTRQVVAAACNRVISVYCWFDLPKQQGEQRAVKAKPPSLNKHKLEQLGTETADSAMIFDDDQAMEELNVRIANHWTGDGRTDEWAVEGIEHGNPPGTKSLKGIMGR